MYTRGPILIRYDNKFTCTSRGQKLQYRLNIMIIVVEFTVWGLHKLPFLILSKQKRPMLIRFKIKSSIYF